MLKRDQIIDSCITYIPKYDKRNFIQAISSQSSNNQICQTQFYKQQQNYLTMQNYRRAAVVLVSLVPAILYKTLPILKDNSDWRVRSVLTVAMLVFPYQYNQKIMKKQRKKFEEEMFVKHGSKYKKYLLCDDQKYLYE